MARREFANTQGIFQQDAETHAGGIPHQHQSRDQRWSESDDEYTARMNNGHSRPSESREDLTPPYSDHHRHHGGRGMLRNGRSNQISEEGGRLDYVTNSSGHGERAASPYWNHIDSSEDDGESENAPLESGRYVNRRQWDADHQWDPSSDESSGNANEEVSQGHRHSISQTRNVAHHRQASGDDDSDREVPRVRSRQNAGSRRSHQGSLAGRGDHTVREGPRRQNPRQGRRQGHH